MALAQEITGTICMVGAGASVAAMMMLSTVMRTLGFPYFAFLGTAEIAIAVVLVTVTAARGELSKLSLKQWKWVFVRGFAGTAIFGLALLSIAAGAPAGDSSALQSVNVVVAALLGQLFLGEHLRALHIFALCLSFFGALMVSKVETLVLPTDSQEGQPWLGYGLALASGVASGISFIAARKSQGINPWILTASVCLQVGVMLWSLRQTGLVHDAPLGTVRESPGASAGVFACLTLLGAFAAGTMSKGSQLCPAAVSSTIFNSVSMSFCYTGQVIFHGEAPQASTLLGAAFMLLSVVLLALARRMYTAAPCTTDAPQHTMEAASVSTTAACAPEVSHHTEGSTPSNGADDVETESLASFAASEFSGFSLRERTVARVRAVVPPMQVVGAAIA